MTTKANIEAILAPAKAAGEDVGCEFNGKYWEVWRGKHAGGREDGESLARFLMEGPAPKMAEPEPVEIPAFLQEPVPEPIERIVHVPDPEQAAENERLRARLAEAEAALEEVHAPTLEVEVPDFLKFDPLSEFIATEQRDGETDEATLQRLRDELLDYFSLERGDGLTEAEAARKRYLSSNIKPTGD